MIKLGKPIRIPLYEAAIEARFAGDARMDSWRGYFQQVVRSKYPLLFVPSVNSGDFPALLHYQFSNEAQTARVSLSLNSLAFSSMEYPGWEKFHQEFLDYLSLLRKDIAPNQLTRFGVRFINHFDSDLSQQLRQNFPKDYLAPLKLAPEFYLSVIRFNRDNCKLLINVRKENNLTILDYDAYVENVSLDEVPKYLRMLHDCIETELFDVLKPSYTQQLSQNKPRRGD